MEVRTRKIRRARWTTGEATHHHEIEGGDDSQHTRYITWPGQDADDSQRSILQPVSGSGGRKMEGKAETRHGAKERLIDLTALRLIARQGANEKSQLDEWKAVYQK